MHRIVLLRARRNRFGIGRHRFTGWTDVDLTAPRRSEAKCAGEKLKTGAVSSSIRLTPRLLKRAIKNALARPRVDGPDCRISS